MRSLTLPKDVFDSIQYGPKARSADDIEPLMKDQSSIFDHPVSNVGTSEVDGECFHLSRIFLPSAMTDYRLE